MKQRRDPAVIRAAFVLGLGLAVPVACALEATPPDGGSGGKGGAAAGTGGRGGRSSGGAAGEGGDAATAGSSGNGQGGKGASGGTAGAGGSAGTAGAGGEADGGEAGQDGVATASLEILQGNETCARGVSGDGSVVVGRQGGALDTARKWVSRSDEITLPLLDTGDPGLAFATAITPDGSKILGSARTGSVDFNEAVIWAGTTNEISRLGDTATAGVHRSASAISADGTIVAGDFADYNVPRVEAFRWTRLGGFQMLGFLGADGSSRIEGMSSDGRVLVGSSSDDGGDVVAARWTAADGWEALGAGGTAHAANEDGSIIVGMSEGAGFKWEDGTIRELTGSEPQCGASAVSKDGRRVVGGCAEASAIGWDDNGVAYVWDDTGVGGTLADVLLEAGYEGSLDALDRSTAYAVSEDGGTIVGCIFDANDKPRAFRARVPAP